MLGEKERKVSKHICVVTSDVPFVEGGHIVIARELVHQLRKHGYFATLVRTPQNPFGKQVAAYIANACTNLSETGAGDPIDGVISLRFPAFAVGHPHHSCWLNHRMREYYDLWPKFKEMLSWKGKIKEGVRRFIMHRMDEFCLDHRVKKLYAQSKTIAERLRTWGGHNAEVLYPPAVEAPYRLDEYGGYIFAVSRLINHKRMDLLIRAAAKAKVPCKIAGDGPDADMLRDLIEELGASKYIELVGRINQEQLLDHYAKCRAVAFPSFNEDYGLVTLEAFSSSKAVITLADSGGPTEIIEHESTGLIADPDIESFAANLERVMDSRDYAEKLGRAAREEADRHSWSRVIDKLVEW